MCAMPFTSCLSLRYTSTNGSERRAKPDPTMLGRRYGCLQNSYPAAAQARESERWVESYTACPKTKLGVVVKLGRRRCKNTLFIYTPTEGVGWVLRMPAMLPRRTAKQTAKRGQLNHTTTCAV